MLFSTILAEKADAERRTGLARRECRPFALRHIARHERRRVDAADISPPLAKNRIAKCQHGRADVWRVRECVRRPQELRRLAGIDAVQDEDDWHGRMAKRALFERPQIAIRRSRHDDGIEVALLCMTEERTIPRLPMQLAPHRRDEPRDAAHVRIRDGRLRQPHDRLSIVHRKDEVFWHIEHDLVPKCRELFREDAVEIDLMPARRHDVLKNRDAHGCPPFSFPSYMGYSTPFPADWQPAPQESNRHPHCPYLRHPLSRATRASSP